MSAEVVARATGSALAARWPVRRCAALSCPRPTYHQANAPRAMPVTQVHGHQDRSPVWKCGDDERHHEREHPQPDADADDRAGGHGQRLDGCRGPEGGEVLLRVGLLGSSRAPAYGAR